jgi:hypothetical protein
MSLEVPGEMGLIVEAHTGGDIGGRLAIEKPLPGELDAPAEPVRMRGHAKRL